MPSLIRIKSLIRFYESLSFPNGTPSIGLNFTEPTEIHIIYPYRVENNGFYDIKDITVKITLSIEYIQKASGKLKNQQILSAYDDKDFLPIGRSINRVYEKDYLDFNWSNIDIYILEVDESEQTSVFMDIEFSFYLAGVEKDIIIFKNINLTSFVEVSSIGVNGLGIVNGINSNFTLLKNDIYLIAIALFAILCIMGCFFLFSKKNLKKSVNIKKLKVKKAIKETRLNIYGKISKIILYSIITITWDIILIVILVNSSYYSAQYLFMYQIVSGINIKILCLINYLSLLTLFHPRKYYKYSSSKGMVSVAIASLTFLSFSLWSLTSVIVYQLDINTLFIRDTFPSFIPFFILLGANLGIQIVDYYLFKVNKEEFTKIRIHEERLERNKPYKAKNEEEFIFLIFQVIDRLISKNTIPSISQIRKEFKKQNYSPVAPSGEGLNVDYFSKLVNDLFLNVEEVNSKANIKESYCIYYLTRKAKDYILEYLKKHIK